MSRSCGARLEWPEPGCLIVKTGVEDKVLNRLGSLQEAVIARSSACLLSHSCSYSTFIGWCKNNLWVLSIHKHFHVCQRCCFSCWNALTSGSCNVITCVWWSICLSLSLSWGHMRTCSIDMTNNTTEKCVKAVAGDIHGLETKHLRTMSKNIFSLLLNKRFALWRACTRLCFYPV